VLAWQPGLEGGNAIADIISGKVNPSGRLATTFAMDYKDEPTANNFPGAPENKPTQVTYDEGIYVGYRYFDTYKVKPAYEFGYGLSYTKFKLSDISANKPDARGNVSVKVTVTNTGDAAGKEVVELYLSAPSQKENKPEQELKAFAKTHLLAPGQSQFLVFTLHAGDLASFYTDKSAWIADAGEYKVHVGTSSRNIEKTVSFNLSKDIVTEKTGTALTPQVPIDEWKGK